MFLNAFDNVVGVEADFGCGGVFVAFAAVTGGAADGGG